MNYKGYNITDNGGCLEVEGVRDFNPVHTFECGQCFRWVKSGDGGFSGIARGRAVSISMRNDVLLIGNSSIDDFKAIWFDYLDLGRDYTAIKEKLMKKDEIMKKAVEFGWGIRLLRQDTWEALISFIISANNRIPRIMKIVAALSQAYGSEVAIGGESLYSFPEAGMLADGCIRDLEACGGGFRCKYISKTAKMINTGTVELDRLKDMDTDAARCTLTLLPGVGNKVADCTLLYSGTKYNVFPTDVWVKRVMEELYFKREASFKEIQAFAAEYFGGLAGFAQQYLFYYARENRIGVE